MRAVIIGGTGWTVSHAMRIRGGLVRMVFSLAAQNGYDVLAQGAHWHLTSVPPTPAMRKLGTPITDEQWAKLMGPQYA